MTRHTPHTKYIKYSPVLLRNSLCTVVSKYRQYHSLKDALTTRIMQQSAGPNKKYCSYSPVSSTPMVTG
jgi:hypothetical protein